MTGALTVRYAATAEAGANHQPRTRAFQRALASRRPSSRKPPSASATRTHGVAGASAEDHSVNCETTTSAANPTTASSARGRRIPAARSTRRPAPRHRTASSNGKTATAIITPIRLPRLLVGPRHAAKAEDAQQERGEED